MAAERGRMSSDDRNYSEQKRGQRARGQNGLIYPTGNLFCRHWAEPTTGGHIVNRSLSLETRNRPGVRRGLAWNLSPSSVKARASMSGNALPLRSFFLY